MEFAQKVLAVIMGILLSGVSMSSPESNQDSYMDGILSVGEAFSYILYVGEESGDSIVWYFDTHSEAGKKILSVCKVKSNCIVQGSARIEVTVPAGIPEATSGTSKIISVSSVSVQ